MVERVDYRWVGPRSSRLIMAYIGKNPEATSTYGSRPAIQGME